MFIFISDLMAMAPQTQENPGIMGQVILFGIIFFIFFFLVIRPQQQKAKQHTAMLGELNKGDKIITGSGIFGKIDQRPDATEDFLFVEIADKTVVKILKTQVNEMVKLPPKKEKKDKKEKETK